MSASLAGVEEESKDFNFSQVWLSLEDALGRRLRASTWGGAQIVGGALCGRRPQGVSERERGLWRVGWRAGDLGGGLRQERDYLQEWDWLQWGTVPGADSLPPHLSGRLGRG